MWPEEPGIRGGGCRREPGCWPKGLGLHPQELVAARALGRTQKVGEDQEVGHNVSAEPKGQGEEEWGYGEGKEMRREVVWVEERKWPGRIL